jgi:hypothetical protein
VRHRLTEVGTAAVVRDLYELHERFDESDDVRAEQVADVIDMVEGGSPLETRLYDQVQEADAAAAQTA